VQEKKKRSREGNADNTALVGEEKRKKKKEKRREEKKKGVWDIMTGLYTSSEPWLMIDCGASMTVVGNDSQDTRHADAKK